MSALIRVRWVTAAPNPPYKLELTHRENIHAPERVGVIGFETVPLIEVELIGGVRKLLVKFPDHAGIFKGFEAEERQVVLAQKCRDLGNCKTMLHDVEQQVTAAADTEKIVRLDQRPPAIRLADHLLAASPDVIRRGAVAAR